jgi:hypothetical protein
MSRASTANRSKRGSSRGSSRGSNNGGKRGKLQVEPNMGGPLSPSQKAAILAEAMLKEEEEVAKHRIGAVYADPEVRRRLANGRGPMVRFQICVRCGCVSLGAWFLHVDLFTWFLFVDNLFTCFSQCSLFSFSDPCDDVGTTVP